MPDYKLIGHDYQTPDIVAKATGQAKYAEDFRADGMLFCKLLLSPEPHARVRNIDTRALLAMKGVAAVLTADELPAPKPVKDPTGAEEMDDGERGLTNEPVFEGEPILAVAAVDELTAAEAIEKINVDLELLPFVIDPLDSLRPGGPNARTEGNIFVPGGGMKTLKWTSQDFQEVAAGRIPWDAKAGEEIAGATSTVIPDVATGFKQADFILDETLFQQSTPHQPLETRSAMAYWQNGKLYLYGSTQSVAQTVPQLATWVGIDPSQVVFIGEYCGGGFGSKALGSNSMAIPALLSRKTSRPVMMRISREEETYIGRMRRAGDDARQPGGRPQHRTQSRRPPHAGEDRVPKGRPHHRHGPLHHRGQRSLRAARRQRDNCHPGIAPLSAAGVALSRHFGSHQHSASLRAARPGRHARRVHARAADEQGGTAARPGPGGDKEDQCPLGRFPFRSTGGCLSDGSPRRHRGSHKRTRARSS